MDWRSSMNTTETLYRKQGRRYVPAYSLDDWHMSEKDAMPVGTFRITWAAGDGSYRYEYNVTPDTASFVAAAMVAKKAMCDAMHEASQASPIGMYTEKQKAALAKARQIMQEAGCMLPTIWQHKSQYEIADAGIEAVKKYGACDGDLRGKQ